MPENYLSASDSQRAILTKQANYLVEDVLSRPNGRDILALASIIARLHEVTDGLSSDERLLLAKKTMDACLCSAVPLLTEERVDAVRSLLETGMTTNRSPEFPAASPGQTKNLLLTCDIDIFTEIVDAVAVDNQSYYAPDNEYTCDQDVRNRAVEAIENAAQAPEETKRGSSSLPGSEQNRFVFEEDYLFVNDDYNTLNGYLVAFDFLVDKLRMSEDMENINFYANYNVITGDVSVVSVYYTHLPTGEVQKEVSLELTDQEKDCLVQSLEQYCRERYGFHSCLQFVNAVRAEDGIGPIINNTAKSPLSDQILVASSKVKERGQEVASSNKEVCLS